MPYSENRTIFIGDTATVNLIITRVSFHTFRSFLKLQTPLTDLIGITA
jgi:hypothetical protein